MLLVLLLLLLLCCCCCCVGLYFLFLWRRKKAKDEGEIIDLATILALPLAPPPPPMEDDVTELTVNRRLVPTKSIATRGSFALDFGFEVRRRVMSTIAINTSEEANPKEDLETSSSRVDLEEKVELGTSSAF